MFAYRVEKQKHLSTILKGIPGEVSDFRWNTKGHPIIYSSESRSLALHEKCANLSKPLYGLDPSCMLVQIELPDGKYRRVIPKELPEGWDMIGSYHPHTQRIGDEFTSSEELALMVPSTIIKGEYNILINPWRALVLQPRITIEPIDERLKDLRW
ncbi:MAG: RES family NAD+ phosphorylase [Saprospiraceae bacterium]|nr:RES family NAD+ phosphorylase [Saprospiraceae bacterium]